MIRLITNFFILAFFFDAGLSVIDEFVSFYFEIQSLNEIRNYTAYFVILFSLPMFIIVGFDARLPKIILFPLILFVFWSVFAAYPLSLLLSGKALTAPLSVVQLLMGIMAFIYVRKLSGGAWLLTTASLSGPVFKARYTITFLLANLLFFPAMFGVLLVSTLSSTIIASSGEFVRVSKDGIYLADKEFRKDKKNVRLAAMVHIGEYEYYDDLYASILSANTVVLREGVTDDNSLITGPLPYNKVARYFGLRRQPHLGYETEGFVPSNENQAVLASEAQLVDADIDVQEFSEETIDFLNNFSLYFGNNDSFVKALLNFLKWDSVNMTEGKHALIMNDLIGKRNKVLLQHLESTLLVTDSVIIPWGAMHMAEIQAELINWGFELEKSSERLAIEFFD